MSLPPGPGPQQPPGPTTTGGAGGAGGAGGGAPTTPRAPWRNGEPAIFTSVFPEPDGQRYSDVLAQVIGTCNSAQARWDCVKMLRVLRLKLHDRRIQPDDFKELARRERKVFRVGRLSEVGVQGMVASVRSNPHHLDYDWFGPEINLHWWNEDIDGGTWEKTVTRALLHFLEISLDLEPSKIDPEGWSWKKGVEVGTRNWWGLLVAEDMKPSIKAGFEKLVLEWDYNDRDEFGTQRLNDDKTLRLRTDLTFRFQDVIPQREKDDYGAA